MIRILVFAVILANSHSFLYSSVSCCGSTAGKNANIIEKNSENVAPQGGLGCRSHLILLSATSSPNSINDNKKKVISRFLKTVVFLALTFKAFSVEKLIHTKTDIINYVGVSTVLTSCALFKIEDCYSFGYGGSLLAIGLMCTRNLLTMSSIPWPLFVEGLLHTFSYISYGLRMITFMLKRNSSKSYLNSSTNLSFQSLEKKIPLVRRVTVWLSTAIILGLLYSLPLHFHIESIRSIVASGNNYESTMSKLKSSVSCLAAVFSLLAIFMQYVADNQKLAYKEKYYARNTTTLNNESSSTTTTAATPALMPFCSEGLYRTWRHPNYLAEFFFHVGVFFAAVPAFNSWGTVFLAALGPTIFASIILAATTSLEKRQKDRYGGKTEGAYENWVASSRRFL